MTAPAELLQVTVKMSGTERVIDRLERIERNATDLRPVWPDVVAALRAIVARAFETEGASTADGPWPELAESTVRERARLMGRAGEGFSEGGPAHPILQRSGRLRRALTTESPNSTVRATPSRLQIELSPAVSYFAFHQSTAPRRKLPRRAPISFTPNDVDALLNPILIFITGSDR